MAKPVAEHYDARWGYRHFDAERYERRRYGGWGRRLNPRLTERALARAPADRPQGPLVLDAPCGTGILSAFLHRRGFRVIGADISPAMLAVAGRRGAALGHVRADFRRRRRGAALGHGRADLERPPCRSHSVAAIESSRFMMHLPPDTRTRVFRTMAD